MDEQDVKLMGEFEEFLRQVDEREKAEQEAIYEADFECDCEQCLAGWTERTG